MHRSTVRIGLCASLAILANQAWAQDVSIYADALANGFVDYSYGGGSDFANGAPVNGGTKSIAFTGNANFNAISFAHPSGSYARADFSGIRFFVHGGATGGQQLNLLLQTNSDAQSEPVIALAIDIDAYVQGGAIVANAWRQVDVPLAGLAFTNDGSFDRIDLQTATGAQATLYLDDVSLVARASTVFQDAFEGVAGPPPGQVRFASAAGAVGEGDGDATITVQRIGGSAGAITVQYATGNGSAVQPGDYAMASGMVAWADGDAADKTFSVAIVDDPDVEPPETVALALFMPGGGATLAAPSSAQLTIEDDDVAGPPGMLRFSAAMVPAIEDDGPVTISVQRVNGSAGAVSVQYATSNGTAQQPGDYASANGTLNWNDGDMAAKSFTVTPVNDGLPEAVESITLTLSNPGGGAMLGVPSTATLMLSDPAAPAPFRGTNLVGMEMFYGAYPQATGPVPGQNYPVFDNRLVDYYAGKGVDTLRFLFSWEAMQSVLMGPIPASNAGNYKAYFDNYTRIVDYATNTLGMNVVVEPWQADAGSGAGGPRWRGNLVGSASVPIAAWSDFWTRMATIFAANPRVAFGLVNEPNNMSTMGWWAIAQAGVDAIRASGATQRIYVPGNGYSAASTWVIGNAFYDTDAVKRSNAYGWLNANGPGQPITDPLGNMAAEVHTYLDPNQGGSSTEITSVTSAREHMAVVVDEARLRGYQVWLGEIGMLASVPIAPATWADFIAYFEANPDTFIGYTWWAGGDPVFWPDIGANGGGHYSISPTNPATYTGDTINMDMIEGDF